MCYCNHFIKATARMQSFHNLSLPFCIIYICLIYAHFIKGTLSNGEQCQLDKRMQCNDFLSAIQSNAGGDVSMIDDARQTRLRWLNSEKCYVLVKKAMTYSQARSVCANAGGHMAWVKDHRHVQDLFINAILEAVIKPKSAMVYAPGLQYSKLAKLAPQAGESRSRRNGPGAQSTNDDEQKFKDEVWVGLSTNWDTQGLVWDCPEHQADAAGDPPKYVEDVDKYCFQPDVPRNGSAALCHKLRKRGSDMIREDASCLCWHETGDNARFPFYCEISSVCDVATVETCSSFQNKVQQLVAEQTTFLIRNEHNTIYGATEMAVAYDAYGLHAYSCYVLVNQSRTWEGASQVCAQAGGRLAWIPESFSNGYTKGAQTLLAFAQQHNAIDGEGLSAWVGLMRLELKGDFGAENNSWWVKKWICPSGRGQCRYIHGTPYIFSPLNTSADPDQPVKSYGYLQRRIYQNTSEHPFSFHSWMDKLLPFYCEAAQIGAPTILHSSGIFIHNATADNASMLLNSTMEPTATQVTSYNWTITVQPESSSSPLISSWESSTPEQPSNASSASTSSSFASSTLASSTTTSNSTLPSGKSTVENIECPTNEFRQYKACMEQTCSFPWPRCMGEPDEMSPNDPKVDPEGICQCNSSNGYVRDDLNSSAPCIKQTECVNGIKSKEDDDEAYGWWKVSWAAVAGLLIIFVVGVATFIALSNKNRKDGSSSPKSSVRPPRPVQSFEGQSAAPIAYNPQGKVMQKAVQGGEPPVPIKSQTPDLETPLESGLESSSHSSFVTPPAPEPCPSQTVGTSTTETSTSGTSSGSTTVTPSPSPTPSGSSTKSSESSPAGPSKRSR